MQILAFAFGAAVIFSGLLAWPVVPQDRPPERPDSATDEEKQVQAILTAKEPFDAAAGYKALFKSITPDSLLRLQMNASDTIAIQAAWQQVELTVPEKPEETVRPNRDRLARFLGFLEGRARLQAPQWWAEALLDARANRRGNVYAGGLNVAGRRGPKPIAAAPRKATFGKQEGRPVVRVGSVFAPIPEDLQDTLKFNEFNDGVSALITPARCYVAVHDSVGYPYRLACVERVSGKTGWVAKVWASWWGAATGVGQQWVEVTEQGDRVVVFGVASVGFHVEAFRKDDGVNLLRFSNSYSGP